MDSDSNELLAQINRNLELLVRLDVERAKAGKSQKEMILLLDSVGFRPSEIASFLQTSANTVNPTLSRARKERR